jgi:hypothetical protein
MINIVGSQWAQPSGLQITAPIYSSQAGYSQPLTLPYYQPPYSQPLASYSQNGVIAMVVGVINQLVQVLAGLVGALFCNQGSPAIMYGDNGLFGAPTLGLENAGQVGGPILQGQSAAGFLGGLGQIGSLVGDLWNTGKGIASGIGDAVSGAWKGIGSFVGGVLGG